MYLKRELTKSQYAKIALDRLDHIKKLVEFGSVALKQHKEINAAVLRVLDIPKDEWVDDDIRALLVNIAAITEPYVKLAEKEEATPPIQIMKEVQ